MQRQAIHFHSNILYWRKKERYTQNEVAEMVGATLGSVKSYESGRATPPIEVIVAYAKAMRVTLDALVLTKINDKNYISNKAKKSENDKSLEARISALEDLLRVNVKVNMKDKKIKYAVPA